MNQPKTKMNCAIYTRKSSEEGLEMEYNSLDAQYDAANHYIRAQASQGWTLVNKRYDDGGFSGGNMDRPGLKQLLIDVEAGLIDVIVVYKMDRRNRKPAALLCIACHARHAAGTRYHRGHSRW